MLLEDKNAVIYGAVGAVGDAIARAFSFWVGAVIGQVGCCWCSSGGARCSCWACR